MITPEQAKESYRRALRGHVTVRRYTGIGTSRPKTDITGARARVVGYKPNELVGGIVQGDKRVILYADDVGSLSPLKLTDKIIEANTDRELSIVALDASTRKVGDTLIAYELAVRG